jgi:hypothetical protein
MQNQEKDKKENDTFKAILDSLNNFTGTLTGKNLEEKLVEYSEVYGEILLYLYNQIENQKKEIKFLKKEIIRLEKRPNQNISHTKKNPNLFYLYILVFISLGLNIILLIQILK